LEAKMTLVNGTDTNGADGSPTEKTATTTKRESPKSAPPRRRKPVQKRLATRPAEQAKIAFPYRDLDTGVSVALAMIGAGGVALKTDQLAGVMNLQVGSGNFVLKVMTARQFGLVTFANGMYELTDTGFAVVDRDEKRQRAARAQAFLNVPLYRRTYEEFKGRQLPPRPHGLEQAFIRFGVSPKSVQQARLAFDKSAAQAGYFAAGPDRLIEPILSGSVGGVPPTGRPPSPDEGSGNGDRGGNERVELTAVGLNVGVGRFHPFIQGLLDRLPEPDTTWTIEGRAKWLLAAANCFDLLYQGSGEISVTFKPGPDPEPHK
jgi:hypothetical protein